MTKTEKYTLIKTIITDAKDNLTADYDYDTILAFCDAEIAAIANKAAKAREKAEEKKTAPNPLRDALYAALTPDEFLTIPELAVITNEAVGKVTYQLNALVKDELVEKTDVTKDGRKIKGFRKLAA